MKKNHFKIIAISFSVLFAIIFFSRSSSATTINKSSSNNTLQTGLVGWWTFDGADQASTVTSSDKSGNGNSAGKVGGVTVVAGKIGQGKKFDGTTGYLRVADSASLRPTSSITMSTWVKLNSLNSNNGILTKGNFSGGNGDFQIAFFNGKIEVRFNNGAQIHAAAGATPTVNKWSHIVATYNGVSILIYVNGVKVSSSCLVGTCTGFTISTSTNNLIIGGYWSPSYTFNGSMDDTRIYNRALSPAEIVQLFTQGGGKINKTDTTKPTLKTGLVGHWTFDAKDVTANTTTDKSGQGNDGTRTSVTPVIGKIGQALKFNGTSSAVLANDSSTLDITGNKLTYGFWVKTGSLLANKYFLSKGTNVQGYQFYTQGTNNATGYINTSISGTVTSPAITNIFNNKWHFVMVVYDGSKLYSYVDGVSLGSNPATGNILSSAGNTLSIGSYYNGLINFFPGSIDDVRIYNRALSPAEVVELFTQGGGKINKTDLIRAQLREGLVGHWTFDGADVTTITTTDKSGYGNNGTRTGVTTRVAGKIGQGIKLNGAINNNVNAYNAASFQITTGTVSAWIKVAPGSAAYRGILIKSQAWGLFLSSDILIGYSWAGTTGDKTTNINLADNKWHHVVQTFESGVANGMKIYIDGVLKLTSNLTVLNQTESVVIGAEKSAGGFSSTNGVIDDARVYNRVLSQAEVTELYRMGR